MDESAAAHRNMLGFISWINERVPGARVEHSDDELIVESAHPFPFFSQVIRDHERDDGAGLVRRACDFFGGRSFMVVARPGADDSLEQAAIDAGLTLALDRYPEMVCSEPIEEWPVADGFELRQVGDAETAAAYWAMSGRAYVSLGCPPDLFDGFPPDLLLAPEIQACVATRGDEVVAGALVLDVAGNGYVGWVGVVEEARRRGLAAAVTSWVTNRSFESGAKLVSLEASPMGDSLYPKLGYRELYNYRLYMRQPAQPA
jgi:ribosomal protein S18 acetylase RimI-like enzyme